MAGITRDIQLSWDSVAGVVEYQIFRKQLQPAASDFVYVASVAPPTTNYTFTGADQDERDQFQVKAFQSVVGPGDGVLCDASNAVQNIFFPDRSSAIFETNSSTPDNQPMTVPVDIPYLTKDEFLLMPIAEGLGLTTNSKSYLSGSLDYTLLQASAHVNRYCRRYFQKQTIDEVYPNVTIQVSNPRLCVIPLKNPPYTRINSVTIQVLKFFIPFSLEYLIQPFSQQSYYQIVPMLSTSGQGAPMGTGTPIPSVILEQSQLGIVWTNYTCGYEVIPQDIKYATGIIAGKMIGLGKYNPLGLAQFKTQTTMQTFTKSKDDSPLDSEVMKILDPYRLLTIRMT